MITAYVHSCDNVRTMVKKLTKTGNSFALVLDKPLLQQLGIDEDTELEISTNGDVLVVTPVRSRSRERKFQKAVQKINEKYAGLFKRLSE
jgi:antitoxin MazE